MAGSVRREGGPRSEEGADHKLTPSCFSPDSPHNLTLTPSPGVGCREKLLELGKGVLLPTVGLSGTALKKEGPESGAIGAKGLWVPGDPHRPTQGVRLKPLTRSLGRETSWSRGTQVEWGQTVWFHRGSEAASVS